LRTLAKVSNEANESIIIVLAETLVENRKKCMGHNEAATEILAP